MRNLLTAESISLCPVSCGCWVNISIGVNADSLQQYNYNVVNVYAL